jgi:hypothetical protein
MIKMLMIKIREFITRGATLIKSRVSFNHNPLRTMTKI